MENNQPGILYVEDDAQSRKLMAILLKGRMKLTHVTILEDSQDFLTRVQALEPKPDLILLDIQMKPYNGFEMLRMLRQLDWIATRPVVALTASVMNEEIQSLQTAGFDGCLAKPIDISTFPQTLERILAGEKIWRVLN
ncbi:MAG: response regulator [Chloroflexi bacterium]|nr:response regulator [Chloroflexota bacterium]